jgi:hypothetical protein
MSSYIASSSTSGKVVKPGLSRSGMRKSACGRQNPMLLLMSSTLAITGALRGMKSAL